MVYIYIYVLTTHTAIQRPWSLVVTKIDQVSLHGYQAYPAEWEPLG